MTEKIMSTRGIIGYLVDDQLVTTYNHFDSYPSGLGNDVLRFVRDFVKDGNVDLWKSLAQKITVHSDEEVGEERNVAQRILDEENSKRTSEGKNLLELKMVLHQTQWYEVLDHLQGRPADQLVTGHLVDAEGFGRNSLFCEWGYVINFDTSTIEVYEGFQKQKGLGRFTQDIEVPWNSYWPISLIAEISFDNLPEDMSFLESGGGDD